MFYIEKVTLIFVYARGKPQDLSGVKNVGELWCRESTNLNRENKVAKIKLLKPLNTKGRLCLEKAGLLAFAHRQYFALGRVIGRFGFSVKKRKRKIRR